jgi:hypothetical protein
MDLLYLHLRLIQSALDQKAEAEPVGNHRGRSQDRAVIRGHEVASFPSEMGPPMGQRYERASPFLAKFVLSASFTTGRATAHAVSGASIPLVQPATTSRTQYVRFTDEVPRRPVLRGRVSPSYKSHTKSLGDAPETGTAFPRPCLKGCQQRQSRGACVQSAERTYSERQNLRVPLGSLRDMGPVSLTIAATTWRDGTSSCQSVSSLSNSPQQPETGQAAVR